MTGVEVYCSDHSLSFGESLFGTAPRIEAWILLEYQYPYSAKAFEESNLQSEVKERLSAALNSIPYSRLLMIKKKSHPEQPGISFILVKSNTENQRIIRYQLDTYADLLSIDLETIFSHPETRKQSGESSPLVLVCTNGKRDRCCARHGLPFFEALQKHSELDVWQSSHIGGHRFAANVISLPIGITYGRLRISEVQSFVESIRKGQIDLSHYRGRNCYSAEQQAAEYFLRLQTGNTDIDDLRLVETLPSDDNKWRVLFISRTGGQYSVSVRSGLTDYTLFESCDAPDKIKKQTVYYLDEISV